MAFTIKKTICDVLQPQASLFQKLNNSFETLFLIPWWQSCDSLEKTRHPSAVGPSRITFVLFINVSSVYIL